MQAARDALVEAALELFLEHGFDATSVEQIADRVGVSARTFHRYFPAKDDVLFVDAAERHEHAAALLAADDGSRPVLDVLCEAAADLAARLGGDARRQARRQRVIEDNARLRARSLRATEELADLFAAHVARRLGRGPADRVPRLVGTWAVGTIRVAHRRWLADPDVDMVAEVRAGFELLADVEAATAEDSPMAAPAAGSGRAE